MSLGPNGLILGTEAESLVAWDVVNRLKQTILLDFDGFKYVASICGDVLTAEEVCRSLEDVRRGLWDWLDGKVAAAYRPVR